MAGVNHLQVQPRAVNRIADDTELFDVAEIIPQLLWIRRIAHIDNFKTGSTGVIVVTHKSARAGNLDTNTAVVTGNGIESDALWTRGIADVDHFETVRADHVGKGARDKNIPNETVGRKVNPCKVG